MKLLFWLAVAILALLIGLFAASNRGAVSLGLWPFSYAVDLPLYLAVLGALLIGFVVGAIGMWLAAGRTRREARRRRRHIAALERELAATQAQLADSPAAPPLRLRG